MRTLILLAFLSLTACGRPLSEAEMRFAAEFHGPDLDTSKVRIRQAPVLKLYNATYPTPPRTTCAQKILPPVTEPTITSAPGATVLFNTINVNPDYIARDYLPAYPDAALLLASMFLAHELVHVWQWQNRAATGYHPLKAAQEHQSHPDPYLFELSNTAEFLDFGYEQQGAIAAEYVCCAALAPKAPRTTRLERLMQPHFDLAAMTTRLDNAKMVLPWKGVELDGICD
ncbi:hypothetical protein BDE40_0570 [Litoreibacter halocynthiae]|uniref:Uncharacterized protein n=1 Tax=Litoreibacter halocynthiae TaxID=1242689 RepID=A0A4R7LP85_9RHOB|nr:hypothetical protein [Litoreibacter halocynthiae]TDT77289.1 hypothetical protein BDE40_0570 [Litoreibacter halocynthiae]